MPGEQRHHNAGPLGLLTVLDQSVRDGEMDFATALVNSQRVFRHYDLAIRLTRKSDDVENYDPVLRQRWQELLHSYLGSIATEESLEERLETREITEEEAKLLYLMFLNSRRNDNPEPY